MIQVIANGLVNGAILALMAISLTIIFGIFRVPHFGLGGIFVWGAFRNRQEIKRSSPESVPEPAFMRLAKTGAARP